MLPRGADPPNLRLSERYEHYSATQRAVAKRVSEQALQLAAESETGGHLVELGCGTGHLTRLLAGTPNWTRYTAVDSSRASLDFCAAKGDCPTVYFECCDMAEWRPEPDTRWIVSNAALHWLDDPFQHIGRIQQLAPDAVWVFSAALRCTYRELRHGIDAVDPSVTLAADRFFSPQEWELALSKLFRTVSVRVIVLEEPFESIHPLIRTAQASTGMVSRRLNLNRARLATLEDHIVARFGRLSLSSYYVLAECHP